MLSDCTNVNKQHSLAPQFTSLEFLDCIVQIGYAASSQSKKLKNANIFFITINLSYLRFSRL